MRPLTLDTPKPLLKVAGKPIIEHLVSVLPKEAGELLVVVGYLGNKIKNYCGKNFLGRQVKYIEQEKKLGTFDALKKCEPFLEKGERFFLFYADDIHGGKGISGLLNYDLGLLISEAEKPEKFGVVSLNEDNSIRKIIEKPVRPKSNMVSSGAMLLDKKIFDFSPKVSASGKYYLSEAVSDMIKKYKIYAVRSSLWVPIGYPEDLKKAEEVLKVTNNK